MEAIFGDAEKDMVNPNLTPSQREARRFARMCHMYGPTGRINFNSDQFSNEAVTDGIALLSSHGFIVEPVSPIRSPHFHSRFNSCVLITSKPALGSESEFVSSHATNKSYASAARIPQAQA
jgi:hypothetical protein